jgi:hypothetical protein
MSGVAMSCSTRAVPGTVWSCPVRLTPSRGAVQTSCRAASMMAVTTIRRVVPTEVPQLLPCRHWHGGGHTSYCERNDAIGIRDSDTHSSDSRQRRRHRRQQRRTSTRQLRRSSVECIGHHRRCIPTQSNTAMGRSSTAGAATQSQHHTVPDGAFTAAECGVEPPS